MAYVVVTLFDHPDKANEAMNALTQSGFTAPNIEIIESDPESQSFFKRLFKTDGGEELEAEKTMEFLTDLGVSEEEADDYSDKVKKGKSLVIVRCDTEDKAQEARKIVDRYPFEEGEQPPRRGGAEEGAIEGGGAVGSQVRAGEPEERSQRGMKEPHKKGKSEQTIEAAEEKLVVGKREVESGGVRADKEVTEEKVEEQVNLRDENVDVERRDVDRPAREGEDLFKEETVEVSETREEAVADKETRVKEEVTIDKDVKDRTETITDTVRAEHINIQDLTERTDEEFQNLEPEYRGHFDENYGDEEYNYDDYSRGYRYGMALAQDDALRHHDWETVEPEAGRRWEQDEDSSWDNFKEAVRFGWYKIRGEEEEYEQRPPQA